MNRGRRCASDGTIEARYQRKTPIEHVLLRPGAPQPCCDVM
jgi:hypothetical protein